MLSETAEQADVRIRQAAARGGVPKVIAIEPTEAEIRKAKLAAVKRLAQSSAILKDDEKELELARRISETLQGELDDAMKQRRRAKGAAREDLTRRIREIKPLLARAYRDIGDLDRAAELDPYQRKRLKAGIEAINRPDTEECSCPDPYQFDAIDHNGNPCVLSLPKYAIRKRIFSSRHGRFVFLLWCRMCQHLNARPDLPATLAKYEEMRKNPTNQKPNIASDVEVLSLGARR